MRQAIILAGGKGTRLQSILHGLPKPLVDFCGKPLLLWQLEALEKYGFTEVLLFTHYKSEIIERFVKTIKTSMAVHIVKEPRPLGSGGALIFNKNKLNEKFLVVYGDVFFDVDLNKIWTACEDAEGIVATHPNSHPQDSDLVDTDKNGFISRFSGYPHSDANAFPNLVNAGLVVLKKHLFDDLVLDKNVSDLAKDLFPNWISGGKRLYSHKTVEYLKDIGTPDRLEKASLDFQSGFVASRSGLKKRKAIFLDRDGTLIKDVGHLKKIDEIELLPGAIEAIKRINKSEYLAILVTNQPVIARGELTFDGLKLVHNRFEHLMGSAGCFLDAIYFCPHHPDQGFEGEVKALKFVCNCRKPKPGLILEAERDFDLDLSRSWFLGDSKADEGSAYNAGLHFLPVHGEAYTDAENVLSCVNKILGDKC